MKKIIAILMAMLMMVSLGTTVWATPVVFSAQNEVKVCYNEEYGFAVLEYETENKSIVRTYSRKGDESAAVMSGVARNSVRATSEVETKVLLATLGMEEYFIEQLSDEDLQVYANSHQITSTVSYIRTDAEGNSSYVGEEEIELLANDLIIPPHIKDDGAEGSDAEVAIMQDSYMKLMLMVSYQTNGLYRFTVDATWLKEPKYRLTDSLGICAQNIAIQNNTRSGWYSCDGSGMLDYEVVDEQYEITLTNFQNTVNGSWDGSAALFDLMKDFHVSEDINGIIVMPTYMNYTNHKMHYQFDAYMRYPTVESYFDAMASYDHMKFIPSIDLSIEITVDGAVPGIGFGLFTWNERRTVELAEAVHYIPD